MQVSDAAEEFRFALLKLSPGTQRWYLKRLEMFCSWCAEQGLELEHLKRKGIATYLDQLKTTPSAYTGKIRSSATIHGHARAIRAFLNFCAKDDDLQHVLSSPTVKNVPMPRIEKKLIETLTDEHIHAMFAACDKEFLPHLVVRDRAILSLLLDTGIRASELCGLTLDCVFLRQDDAFIKVFGKGSKWREVGLGTQARTALHRYITRHRHASREEQHVFIGRFKNPLLVDGLKQLLYRLAEFAHLEGARVSAHIWRHTYAMQYLKNGGDVYKLSRLMGHEHVGITELYLKALKQRDARQTGISVLDTFKGR